MLSAAGALTVWVADVLRADERAIGRLSSEPSSSFRDAADGHGVLCLLHRALQDSERFDTIPGEMRDALTLKVRCEQSVELARRAELKRVLAAFHCAGVPSLLLKGAALAYTHYSFPHLRPRVDTDILIRPEDRARAGEVLKSLGYVRDNAVDRDAIFTQSTFRKAGVGAVRHIIDLHWRIANRPLFRDLLSFDELDAKGVEIDTLGPGARTPGPVHSLLLACIHPVAHHRCDWSLIWLYDVALIAERLNSSEWARFRALAAAKKVSYICKYTFELAAQNLYESGRSGGWDRGRAWLDQSGMLDIPDKRRCEEPSAEYLDEEITVRQCLLLDLKASAGITGKARLLLAHAFPDRGYIRAQYQVSSWLGVTSAYIRRISGACRQLVRAAR